MFPNLIFNSPHCSLILPDLLGGRAVTEVLKRLLKNKNQKNIALKGKKTHGSWKKTHGSCPQNFSAEIHFCNPIYAVTWTDSTTSKWIHWNPNNKKTNNNHYLVRVDYYKVNIFGESLSANSHHEFLGRWFISAYREKERWVIFLALEGSWGKYWNLFPTP